MRKVFREIMTCDGDRTPLFTKVIRTHRGCALILSWEREKAQFSAEQKHLLNTSAFHPTIMLPLSLTTLAQCSSALPCCTFTRKPPTKLFLSFSFLPLLNWDLSSILDCNSRLSPRHKKKLSTVAAIKLSAGRQANFHREARECQRASHPTLQSD